MVWILPSYWNKVQLWVCHISWLSQKYSEVNHFMHGFSMLQSWSSSFSGSGIHIVDMTKDCKGFFRSRHFNSQLPTLRHLREGQSVGSLGLKSAISAMKLISYIFLWHLHFWSKFKLLVAASQRFENFIFAEISGGSSTQIDVAHLSYVSLPHFLKLTFLALS